MVRERQGSIVRSLEVPSIQWGLIFGIAASVLTVVTSAPLFSFDALTGILQGDTKSILSFGLLWCAAQIGILVVFLLAGVFASRETGTLGGGMWAAAIANFATVLMTFVIGVIIVPNTRLGNGVNYNAPNFTNGALSAGITVAAVCGNLFNIFFGCAFAAFIALPGAWFGRWLYERGADDEEGDEYEEVPYPGAMAGGYPVFPQQSVPQHGYMPEPGPQQGGWSGPPPGYSGPPPGYGGLPPGYASPPPGYGPPPAPGPQGRPPQQPPRRY